ncbi:MAG: helix-turn-helix transcriptional regulator [Lachnospiraceae bacterium]|nr:helix-turn-helix transcriptional regulator [Lachnospiraceae bacterium]
MRNIDFRLIGKRLRRIREEKGLTQQQLSEISGVHRQQISTIENARASISLDNFIWLVDALESSFDYVVFGKRDARSAEIAAEEIDIDGMIKALADFRKIIDRIRK